MKMRVFNSVTWNLAGGDVGNNSQFFEVCDIVATYYSTFESPDYRGELLAIVQWPDGSITRGHIVSAMKESGVLMEQGQKYSYETGKHNGHRSSKAAAHCFYEADNERVSSSSPDETRLDDLQGLDIYNPHKRGESDATK